MIEAKKDKSRGFGKSIHVTWQQSAKVLATIRAQNIASRTPVFLINQQAGEHFLFVGTFG